MPQPAAFEPAFSYTGHSAQQPTTPQPGVRLDADFAEIARIFAQYAVRQALIQRDDGALANNSVGIDQLSPELSLGLRSAASWVAGTTYLENDAVFSGTALYRCLEGHTAASLFATDLAASKWEVFVDLLPTAQAAVAAAIGDGLEIDEETFTQIFAGFTAADAALAADIAGHETRLDTLEQTTVPALAGRVTVLEGSIPADPTASITANAKLALTLAMVA